MGDIPKSVLEGVDAVIDGCLLADEKFQGFQYHQKRSWVALSKRPPSSFNGTTLIAAMRQCIENNLSKRRARAPSRDNWSLGTNRHFDAGKTSQYHESDEVMLERAIVQRWPNDWTSQMPVASGLFGTGTDKYYAVDLVYDHKRGHYDFIELKLKSDTLLYTAMQILGYGLVYLASRQDKANNLNYDDAVLPLLNASHITLCVLASEAYYADCDLEWLENAINEGLNKFAKPDFRMKFRFEKFTFPWKHNSSPADLPMPLLRERVYQ